MDITNVFADVLRLSELLVQHASIPGQDSILHQNIPGEAYIAKRQVRQNDNSAYGTVPVLDELESSLQEDEASASVTLDISLETWEYHVLYSAAYSVPVLFFNAWKRDGCLLSLEEVQRRAISGLKSFSEIQDVWGTLTQQEHPLLLRPFFHLHPCRTAELMAPHRSKSSNFLVTWLSTIAPAVGLRLNPAYAELVTKTEHEMS